MGETTGEQLKTPHICGVKLVSGEDIICLLSFEPENSRYLMQNPALIFLKEVGDDPSKFQIALSPFCPAAHGGQLSVVTDKIVAMYAPSAEIVDKFKMVYRHPGMLEEQAKAESTEEPRKAPKFEG